jgi:rare lipoprotein A
MCAHNGFRFGTKLKVTNVSTGRFTVCNVQDTGAFTRLGRSLDLSYGSFGKIANPNQGLVRVKIEKIN